MTTKKPPLGTAPYYVTASIRIKELGAAIERAETSTPMQRSKIREWAREIMLQTAIIETLDNEEICYAGPITEADLEEVRTRIKTIKKEQNATCEFCKDQGRKANEAPCSICMHNFINKFEPENSRKEA